MRIHSVEARWRQCVYKPRNPYLRRLHDGDVAVGDEIGQQVLEESQALARSQRRLHNCVIKLASGSL